MMLNLIKLPEFPSFRTSSSQIPQLPLIKMGNGAEPRCNAERNHSPTGEQQSARSTLCKPSGLVIMVWMWRLPVWCQGAPRYLHCQFMNTRFVSEHIRTPGSHFLSDLAAAISHQPLFYNLFSYILLPLDMLMAPNWPRHYGHIKFKLASNYIEIIF